ncbi:protein SUPPRESSOR OF GENE SILENCING 3-like isoform X2 [Hibiscus syriacus]|uniref:protein SUPPRESSOR OF GENE SILENCING 3-like isoform X2 n=1 Tax=Hibiscus syriacus TaxID=106335 RepID=UPI0019205E7F|nr:protein SUPPRESSOR OF GENE SILENCING 3-like isoform X2 [Hibiscus syriacus]
MADATDPCPDLQSVYKVSSRQANRLSRNVADMKLASAQDGDKENLLESDNTPNAWGHPNVNQKLMMQSNRGSEKAADKAWPTQNAVSGKQQGDKTWGNSSIKFPSSEHGRSDPDQSGSALTNSSQDGQIIPDHETGDNLDYENGDDEYDNDENGVLYDSDDIDDYVSDLDDEKSHEARKKNKWFALFFESLEKLTVEEILSPVRRWHCPACQSGPGAINWYRGMQALMAHAMTKTTRRAKMHRVFAEVLVEEMRRRGAFIKPENDAFGKWEGLNDRVADREIVWPPMVIIMNTRYEQDENGKWTGMGNQELLNYFSSYAAVKARHSYGPQGHRGMSVLIFKSSAAGYLEAARLHKHFKEQGRDRDAWDCSRAPFCPGGKRQLYGYIAMKEDLDLFNRHSQGKSGLKFEMRSYQEMVESQIKKINNDSQQLILLKKKVAQEQQHSQVLAESIGQLGEKLRQTTEEYSIARQQSRLQHEQNKEELKEDNFEKLLSAARERVKQSNANPKNNESEHSASEIEVTAQEKWMEEFELEREKLMKSHQDRRLAITQRYWEELIELEKGFEKELTLLMEKYNPDCPVEETTNSPKEQDKKGTTDIKTE